MKWVSSLARPVCLSVYLYFFFPLVFPSVSLTFKIVCQYFNNLTTLIKYTHIQMRTIRTCTKHTRAGLGKTVMTLALILQDIEQQNCALGSSSSCIKRNNYVTNFDKRSLGKNSRQRLNLSGVGGTLIVCPLTLMEQWLTEIMSKTEPNSLQAFLYYGANRSDVDTGLSYYFLRILLLTLKGISHGISACQARKE